MAVVLPPSLASEDAGAADGPGGRLLAPPGLCVAGVTSSSAGNRTSLSHRKVFSSRSTRR